MIDFRTDAAIVLTVALVLSFAYGNPRIMLERKPDLVDWAEDLRFTGLRFVAATQLGYALGR